jgi:hypothetical protein
MRRFVVSALSVLMGRPSSQGVVEEGPAAAGGGVPEPDEDGTHGFGLKPRP